MKKQWIYGGIIAAFVVLILLIWNQKTQKENVPLSEIFPEQEEMARDIEYEFVKEGPIEIPATSPLPVPPKDSGPTVKKTAGTTPLVSSESPSPQAGSIFTIQVASFKDEKSAQEILDQLKQKGFAAFIMSKDLGEQGVRYRTCVGRFATQQEAQDELAQIQLNHKDSFILKTSATP